MRAEPIASGRRRVSVGRIDLSRSVSLAGMKSFDWLGGLESGVKLQLLGGAIDKSFAKDTMIQHGGEVATHVHQIVSGRVRQFILDENGNEILIQVYGGGDVIGDTLGLGDLPYPLWLSAVGPVAVRSWTAKCFADFCHAHVAVRAAVASQTAQRWRIAIVLLTELATLDALGRVAGRLIHLSEFAQIRGALCLDSSQEDLAMMSNVSRQTVNRVLAELKQKDIVRGGYGSILIKDVDALRAYRNVHRRRA